VVALEKKRKKNLYLFSFSLPSSYSYFSLLHHLFSVPSALYFLLPHLHLFRYPSSSIFSSVSIHGLSQPCATLLLSSEWSMSVCLYLSFYLQANFKSFQFPFRLLNQFHLNSTFRLINLFNWNLISSVYIHFPLYPICSITEYVYNFHFNCFKFADTVIPILETSLRSPRTTSLDTTRPPTIFYRLLLN
jgi:hypothetical protein